MSTAPSQGLRSGAPVLLFVPADKPDRYRKALDSGADGVIFDLEDAVGPDSRGTARATLLSWLESTEAQSSKCLLGVRVNNLRTRDGLRDLAAFAEAPGVPDFVVLPKVEDPFEVVLYAEHLTRPRGTPQLLCAVETARGVRVAHEIASASPHVAMLGFGGGDLAAQMGVEPEWDAMFAARTQIVLAAASAGISAMDMPHLKVDDEKGLREATLRARVMGYRSKLAIHPKQVAVLKSLLARSQEEFERARAMVDSYERNAGAASLVDGLLVDRANYLSAKRLVSR